MRIVEWLREEGQDIIHLSEEGLKSLPDEEVFEKAASEKRVILTFDLDFGEIIALSGGNLVSVILFRLRNTRSPYLLTRLKHVLVESSEVLEKGAVITVEETRHRVRKLPMK